MENKEIKMKLSRRGFDVIEKLKKILNKNHRHQKKVPNNQS